MYTTLQLFPTIHTGKRVGQGVAAAYSPGTAHSQSCLFYIRDRTTNKNFLVDTGAAVSIFPPTAQDRKHPASLTLQAANGTPIVTYGQRSLTLDIGLRRTCRWIFILADTPCPILGSDFFRHFGPPCRCLQEAPVGQHYQPISTGSSIPATTPQSSVCYYSRAESL